MIVFDLRCDLSGHVFEAWFSSSSAFEDQQKKHLIACPVCNDTSVSKAIMAPNIGAKGNALAVQSAAPEPVTLSPEGAAKEELRALFGRIAEVQAEAIKSSQWVGKDFERQARAMDAGDLPQGPIHGNATAEQAKDMIADGIAVMPLLIPIVPPEEQN
jgi:hypothetical protein